MYYWDTNKFLLLVLSTGNDQLSGVNDQLAAEFILKPCSKLQLCTAVCLPLLPHKTFRKATQGRKENGAREEKGREGEGREGNGAKRAFLRFMLLGLASQMDF